MRLIVLILMLTIGAQAQGIKHSNQDLKVKRFKLDALEANYTAPTKAQIDAAFNQADQRAILYYLAGIAEVTEEQVRGKDKPSKVHNTKPKKPKKPKK